MKNVIVFGSLNMDLTIESERVPLQGETIAGRGFFANPGGKGANQAVAAAKSGAGTCLAGAVGNDIFGDRLLEALAGYGVGCAAVGRADLETGVAVILRINGDNRIVLSSGANGALTERQAEDAVRTLVHPGDVFLTQMECAAGATSAALACAHAGGAYTIVNVAPPRELPAGDWANIDLVCVNETECEAVTGINPADEKSFSPALGALVALGPQTAVITLGARGSVALSHGEFLRVPAFDVAVQDTTAAGDTYLGVLAAARVDGLPLADAMLRASAAAAVTASRKGAQQAIPTAIEIDAFLKEASHGA